MKLIYAKNPTWANRSHSLINLTVRFEGIAEDLPFTANPDDSEAHGRDLYARAKAGEFGNVSPFNAIAPTVDLVIEAIKTERNVRLTATDWTQTVDIPQPTKDKWATYRQQLRDIPQQQGFPWYAQVVVETDLGYAVDITKAPWPAQPA